MWRPQIAVEAQLRAFYGTAGSAGTLGLGQRHGSRLGARCEDAPSGAGPRRLRRARASSSSFGARTEDPCGPSRLRSAALACLAGFAAWPVPFASEVSLDVLARTAPAPCPVPSSCSSVQPFRAYLASPPSHVPHDRLVEPAATYSRFELPRQPPATAARLTTAPTAGPPSPTRARCCVREPARCPLVSTSTPLAC